MGIEIFKFLQRILEFLQERYLLCIFCSDLKNLVSVETFIQFL